MSPFSFVLEAVNKPANPFYLLLVVVGVLFVITASAYFVMAARMVDPSDAALQSSSLVSLMDQHGLTLLVVELVLLTIATFAAIGTDEFWARRAERRDSRTTADGASAPTPQNSTEAKE
jgi:hypothetical protein